MAIAGAGSVAVLQFRALRAGSSPMTVHSITFVESSPSGASTAPEGRPLSIKVE